MPIQHRIALTMGGSHARSLGRPLSRWPAQTYRVYAGPEHLLQRVEKERSALQRRHSYIEAQFCNPPHGKRRGTTTSAVLAGPFEPEDYVALPPCDGTQASRGALAFGSHRQRRHRTVSTLANPPPSGLTWRRSVHRCRAAARLPATS